MKKSEIVHSIILAVMTLVIIFYFFIFLNKLNDSLKKDFKVSLNSSKSIELKSGPIWFFFDKNNGVISSTKPISNEDKFTLLSLYPKDKAIPTAYKIAIDELAYNSNKEIGDIFHLILVLGSLGAVLGVNIRSLSSLIYHSCFQKDLDMKRWWSWYYLRPIMGIGLGITIVVLSKSKLLSIQSPGELSGFWILGICVLSGFAVSEVTDRFYYSANALFGNTNNSQKNKTATGTGQDI